MYTEPSHKYNLEFSEFSTSPVLMIANSPAIIFAGVVSAVKLDTFEYVLAIINPNPVLP